MLIVPDTHVSLVLKVLYNTAFEVLPNNYLIKYSGTNTSYVGSVTSMSTSSVKTLFSKARPGDFVQMRRKHTGSHSAIIYSVASTGVTFYEANIDGKNGIVKKTYTWSELCRANAAMSLYLSLIHI